MIYLSRWTQAKKSEASSQLQQCIISCLNEGDRFNVKSMAIPAISCGVFGGKPKDCVPIIVQAIRQFFEIHLTTPIQEVSS